ncbi:MAG TPA: lysylphosphatidylglycerol synthase transmembrane domain-containing protein [Anaerolineae bacterium]|nr:lysylphosphatidylglycerol synthase transmembrane domain-containing protein [Anaerolineae bacterium]HQI84409.1 lysylphosphatidylglycerol synthase transmembrane domain-containing protein [Anaerolineae bacterium]
MSSPNATQKIAASMRVPKLMLRLARQLPVLILLGLAVHLLLPQLTTLESSLKVIENMAWWAVALAIGVQVLSYVGSGYLISSLASISPPRLSIGRGIVVTLAASSVGLVAGGMVGNAAAVYRWTRSNGVGKEGALLASWLPSLFNNAILALLAATGVLHLLIVHDLSTLQAIGFGLTLALLVGATSFIVWGVQHRPAFTALLTRIARWWASLMRRSYDPIATTDITARIFGAWDVLRSGGWRQPVLGAALNIGCDMATLFLLFIAAGHAVSPGILLTGYGLPLLLGKVTFLPGGVGIVEGTMAALYNGLGVPNAVTVLVILAYRIISFWVPTVLGFPLVIYLQRTTRPVEETP